MGREEARMATPGFIAPLRVLPTQDTVALAHQLNRVLDLVSQQLNTRTAVVPAVLDAALQARVQALEARLAALGPVPPSGGQGSPSQAATFQTLPDGPGGYAGHALQGVRVASSEARLEYVTLAGGLGGAGAANQVAVWQDATTLTSDAELFYDRTRNCLGIGTATPTNTVDIRATAYATDFPTELFGVRVRLHATLASSGMTGLRIEAPTLAGGVTPTNYVGIQVDDGPPTGSSATGLQSWIAAGAGRWNLYVPGTAQNYLAGRLGIMTTTPSYPLHVVGDAQVTAHMGIGAAPMPGVYHLNAGATNLLSLAVSGNAAVAGTLSAGNTQINALLGIGYAPNPSYNLYTGSARFTNTVLMDGSLDVGGNLQVLGSFLSVAGTIDTRWNLINRGSSYFAGTAQFAAVTGFGTAPAGGWWISSMNGYFTTLNAGWAPVAGYELMTNRLYAAGVSRFNNSVGIGCDPAYGLDVNGTFHATGASRFESNVLVAGGLDVYTYSMMNSLRLGDHVAPGYILDVNGTAYMRSTLGVGTDLTVLGWIAGNGANGISMESYGTNGTVSWTYGLWGNPNFQWCRILFSHVHGVWAGVRFESDAAGSNVFDFRIGGSAVMSVGSWIDAPSDRGVKANITPIGDPLIHLAKLTGCYYDRTDLAAIPGFPPPQTLEYGLIAQDVQQALPEAAFEHDYGRRQGRLWNYTDRPVLALLVEAVKALAPRVDTLEEHRA
jgi:Chaperone of endosialidase